MIPPPPSTAGDTWHAAWHEFRQTQRRHAVACKDLPGAYICRESLTARSARRILKSQRGA